MNVAGHTFEPPAGFRTEEMTVGLRLGLPGAGPAPSFVVQSRPARAGASLETLAAETMTELAQSVANMKNLVRAELKFDDGKSGAVLAYDFPTQTGQLRQYFVLRLDAGRLCTITLTLPSSALTEGNAAAYVKSIASVRPS